MSIESYTQYEKAINEAERLIGRKDASSQERLDTLGQDIANWDDGLRYSMTRKKEDVMQDRMIFLGHL